MKIALFICSVIGVASVICLGTGIILLDKSSSFAVRVDIAWEVFFHFAFFMPGLTYSGLLYNHRVNLAYATLATFPIAVLGSVCAGAFVLCKTDDMKVAPIVLLIVPSISSLIIGFLAYSLRVYLVRTEATQGVISATTKVLYSAVETKEKQLQHQNFKRRRNFAEIFCV